jgi:hypothetical protein
MTVFLTLGRRGQYTQCNAKSKPTKQQCKARSIKGKTKCRFHGGRSIGATTADGKARIAAARTTHGRETRALRAERSVKLSEPYEIEQKFISCIN